MTRVVIRFGKSDLQSIVQSPHDVLCVFTFVLLCVAVEITLL